MRTAFIFLVTMTMLANESESNIRTVWIPLDSGERKSWADTLKSDGARLYVSLDNGYTWRSTDLTDDIGTIAISTDAVYATTYGTGRGVYRSDDRGETWNPIHNVMPTITIVRAKDGSEYEALPHIRQILPTRSGRIIAVGYNSGTYISNDRGETWHNVADEWIRPGRDGPRGFPPLYIAHRIRSMTEFDGYLWVAYSSSLAFRSPDNGETWEGLPYWADGCSIADFGTIVDWTVLDDRLYVAGHEGIGRWNEAELTWEDLSRGLPPPSRWPDRPDLSIQTLAVNRNRIFAGLRKNGVWTFDKQSETWTPVGLGGLTVSALVSHQSDLYALTSDAIFRASIPTVQLYGKAATTWGAVKRQ